MQAAPHNLPAVAIKNNAIRLNVTHTNAPAGSVIVRYDCIYGCQREGGGGHQDRAGHAMACRYSGLVAG